MISLPDGIFSDEEMATCWILQKRYPSGNRWKIKIGSLRVAEYISGRLRTTPVQDSIRKIIRNTEDTAENIGVAYLVYKVLKNVGEYRTAGIYYNKIETLEQHGTLSDAISGIFRENLKVGTPWVMKIINMEFLLEHALSDRLKEQTFYLAAHFSNLVKVSRARDCQT